MLYQVKVIKHRIPGDDADQILWQGGTLAIPRVGERVTFDTKHGPRTYKVSRITNCFITELVTLEVVKVESVYVD